MSLRALTLGLLVSTLGLTPVTLGGQSVEPPRSFRVTVEGRDVVARWVGSGEADLYVGEIDDDPRFDDPRQWAVEDHGGRVHEERLRGLPADTYYLRVRAVDRVVVIRRESAWSHVERVVVGGRDDGWGRADDRWPESDRRRRASVVGGAPRDLRIGVDGDVLRLSWGAVPGADRYVVQLDEDRRFRDPVVLGVEAERDRGREDATIRDVPAGRWNVRVGALDSFVSRAGEWSRVITVDVDRRREVRRRDRDVVQRPNVHRRGHPVFDEHPGRGRGQGHVEHGRDRDDERDDDDEGRGDD